MTGWSARGRTRPLRARERWLSRLGRVRDGHVGGGQGSPKARNDSGSVTVTMLGVIVVLVLLAGVIVTYARTAIDTERTRLAADQAALAAASVLLGSSAQPGSSPCALAATTAERNGARVTSCVVRSTSVQVAVTRAAPLGREARGLARAGAPEGRGP
ncbi:Rv3654c family TadE-like protein [Dermacoccus abyssi]